MNPSSQTLHGIVAVVLQLVAACDGGERRVQFTSDMLGSPLPRNERPTVCEAAADSLSKSLSQAHQRALGGESDAVLHEMSEGDGIGKAVRTRYGLDDGNVPLIKSCAESETGDEVELATHQILVRTRDVLRKKYFAK